jgi:hypothetical protein
VLDYLGFSMIEKVPFSTATYKNYNELFSQQFSLNYISLMSNCIEMPQLKVLESGKTSFEHLITSFELFKIHRNDNKRRLKKGQQCQRNIERQQRLTLAEYSNSSKKRKDQ